MFFKIPELVNQSADLTQRALTFEQTGADLLGEPGAAAAESELAVGDPLHRDLHAPRDEPRARRRGCPRANWEARRKDFS